uniref:Myosin VIIA and Rab interacting protein n=1 Tax=Paramormyrops kingsleyae TaxID=1676925 RepID=A0A3B3SU90_9TELE|nr:rab effector MyRIP-like isoform X1 [Paramormyrops kingsleyae]XP_023660527.1 rab effector MyRIP-like isoform X1 [Paramormyrops kingsleyae]
MGKKIDLSGLTEQEAEHVLEVVQRDMKLRKKEEERLSDMKQELDEEGSRCSLLSRQQLFNRRCCMRCFSPFNFLLKRKRPCGDCGFNVCPACSSYCEEERAWLCSACNKSRFLRTQSLEWYYCNVRRRFKRFGGAKVLKTLYRKFTADQHPPSELSGANAYEESMGNEGSVSDLTFYKQSEEYSISETLHVALRVAEEAVEDSITRAEEHCDSLKRNEAHYLRENKEELIEELATSIVQKIIHRRRKLELPAQDGEGASPPPSLSQQSTLPSQARLKAAQSLWRSRSAFSLTSAGEEAPDGDPGPDDWGWARMAVRDYSSLKRDTGTSLASWKSVDQLDNSSMSSVLQSPDGNWIALQSKQRPRLLTKCKSMVFSALEQESGAVSAYDDMGSGSEGDGASGAALQEIRKKVLQREPEWTDAVDPHSGPTPPGSLADLDTSTQGSPPKSSKQLMSSLRRKVRQHRSPRPLEASGSTPVDCSGKPEDGQGDRVRRSRRHKKSRREAGDQVEHSSSAPEYSNFLVSAFKRKSKKKESTAPVSQSALQPVPGDAVISDTLDTVTVSPGAGGFEPVAVGEAVKTPARETSGRRSGQSEGFGGMEETEIKMNVGGQQRDQKRQVMDAGEKIVERFVHKEGTEAGEPRMVEESRVEVMDEGVLKKYQEMSVDRDESTEYWKLVTGGGREAIRKTNVEVDPQRGSQRDAEGTEKADGERQGEVETGRLGASEDEKRVAVESEKGGETKRLFQVKEKAAKLRVADGGRQTGKEEERPGTTRDGKDLQTEAERRMELEDREPEEEVGWEAKRHSELEESRRAELLAEGNMESEDEEEGRPESEHLAGSVAEREGQGAGKLKVLAGKKEEESLTEEEEQGLETETARLTKRRERLGKKARKDDGEEVGPIATIEEGSPSALDYMSAEDIRREGQNGSDFEQEWQALSSLLLQKYSAASLCSITTEVLRVLNATEDLLEEVEGKPHPMDTPTDPPQPGGTAPGPASHGDIRLDEQLLSLEENQTWYRALDSLHAQKSKVKQVYLAAGAVFRLEGELRELEECARDIGSGSTDEELAQLEEQVASAAAQVQQSDLQVSGIAARISALKSAGLNVAHSAQQQQQQPSTRPQPKAASRLPFTLTFAGGSSAQPHTIDSTRHQRRKLPTPPQ